MDYQRSYQTMLINPPSKQMEQKVKLSLYFTFKLRFFCILSDLGSPKIDLPPKALGPNSILPWNHPIAFSSDRN